MSANTQHLPGTALLLGAGAVIVAVVIGVALVGSNVETYPAGSAEATAQTYVQALFDGDRAAAHATLSPRLQARCRPYELGGALGDGSYRAVFEDIEDDGEAVTIRVRISSMDYPDEPLPFGGFDEETARLVLKRFDGEWRIVDASWPLETCDRR